MTGTMTEIATNTFTARPWAIVTIDDSGDVIDAVLDALTRDPRVTGPVVGYDADTRELDAIFQVDLEAIAGFEPVGSAASFAATMFAQALRHARIEPERSGVSIVEGDDPDQLP